MLRIQTTNLCPDQQQRLHPDFLANEQTYLQMRDSLLAQHRGQWVAVLSGKVVAAGASGDLAYTVGYEHTAVSIEGAPVEYELVEGLKGPQARNVRLLSR